MGSLLNGLFYKGFNSSFYIGFLLKGLSHKGVVKDSI